MQAVFRPGRRAGPDRLLSHAHATLPSFSAPFGTRPALTLGLGILLANAAVVVWLWVLGRNLLPLDRPLQWFSLGTRPEDNSQHLADIYSLAHAASGAGLHLFLRAFWSFRLLLAITSSSIWEIVENTPWVIALFNGLPGPGTYRGDSIVNALSDTVFVALGFLAAHFMPVWAVAAAALVAGGLALLIPSATFPTMAGLAVR